MKRISQPLAWAIFLLVAGLFLLLKNLGLFGAWGDLIWGALFALAGIGFLIWFVLDLQRWWRAIPAFTLIGIGAALILQSRQVQLGGWFSALALFGMAAGLWAVLGVRSEHWWAVIPAGTLVVLGVLLGLWEELGPVWRTAVLFLGIGLVFLILYAVRFGQQDTRWAAIPAAALLLLGLVTVTNALSLPGELAKWWPLLLFVAGAGLMAGAFGLRAGRPAVEELPAVPPAAARPEAVRPEAAPAAQPAEALEKPVDIYELIKQQPEVQPPSVEVTPDQPEATEQ